MKRLNQLIILITTFFLTAYGGWIDLGGGQEGKAPDITLLSDDAYGCRFKITLYGFYLDTVNIPEGQFSRINLPTSTYRMEKGNPGLPKLNESIIIPDNGGVKCEILNEELKRYNILPVIPSKGSISRKEDPDTIPYAFNDIYNNNNWYPDSSIELIEPFIICDYRGMNVCLNVFRHNPTQKLLDVATKFEVVLIYDNPQFIQRESISGSFLGIYENLFLNFSDARYRDQHAIKMVIMTANDDEIYSQALRLRNWKMKKGIFVDEVIKGQDIPGFPNITDIKNYMFDKWVNGVHYFLLVGSYDQFPYFPYAGHPADPCYILFTPDDYPDAFISRLPGRDATQITSMIDKLLFYEQLSNYETYPFRWTTFYLVMASHQTSPNTGIPDEVHKGHMGELLATKYLNGFELYNSGCTPEAITAHLSGGSYSGRSFVNFLGHGSWDRWFFRQPYINPVYQIENVWTLNNNFRLPFILSVACDVCAHIQNEACFGEAWLQRTEYCGAIGFYGSSGDQPYDEPIWADSVAIHSLTYDWFMNEDFPNTIGEMLYAGGISMIQQYPIVYQGPITFNTWNLFGDASVQLRAGREICTLQVYHPSVVPPGNPFEVYVRTRPYNSPGQVFVPCANAVVCIWKEDENYHIYQLTDQYGYVRFDAGPSRMGRTFITVTKYDAGAYEGAIAICDTLIGPNRGTMSNNAESTNSYLNLFITPSISGKTFRIGAPYYATSIDIYNKTGKLVKKVMIVKREFIWNGSDESGKSLPQGVYFIKASGYGKTEVKDVLLIR